ncbi:MarR family winged helix-turn-helix transcriptional regulator [Desertihabitans brevis]|uniref:MarR family winged helix-turn-helix transcriptional regulator n=1 Tax=Desertihabitans brevis TaxID=2268447 RepID=UPI001314D9F2|nr:MarR family winged helix-turn-helix transcriptional regulator [Desertihabitans brevis]
MKLYDIFFDLTRLEMQLWDQVDTALRAATGVPLGRFEALLVLRRLGPSRVQDLSRELSLTVGGTSKLVDRLEAAGLCTRTANPADRRSSVITLTAAAQPLLDTGEAVITSTLETALGAHLSPDDLTSLAGHLQQLRRAADGGKAGHA